MDGFLFCMILIFSLSATKHTTHKIDIADLAVSIRQETDSSENGVGWKLWDSSKILSKYAFLYFFILVELF
jgi:hypothetical protein